MFGATAILALWCGAATSQTLPAGQILNTQLQLGDIVTGQTLNVIDQTDGVSAVTIATGNDMSAAGANRGMNVTSTQGMQGGVMSHGVVNASGAFGSPITLNTAATGNTGDAAISRATITAVVNQDTGASDITGRGQLEGDEAEATDLSISTQAVANSQNFELVNGSIGARVNQSSQANVLADGGAILSGVSGSASVTANAAGNNVTTTGDQQSAQRLIVGQTNAGDLVQASKFTTYGESAQSSTNAMAQGNTISAINEGPLLDVTTNQNNSAYVRAQIEGSSFSYGASSMTAYGAGNSTVAGNIGGEIVLDNTQLNTGGGVEVVVSSDEGSGLDSFASSTAAGNAATAYVCASCNGKMTVSNNQSNQTDVSANVTSTTTFGRSVSGVASAVGNTASFYVSAPASSAQ